MSTSFWQSVTTVIVDQLADCPCHNRNKWYTQPLILVCSFYDIYIYIIFTCGRGSRNTACLVAGWIPLPCGICIAFAHNYHDYEILIRSYSCRIRRCFLIWLLILALFFSSLEKCLYLFLSLPGPFCSFVQFSTHCTSLICLNFPAMIQTYVWPRRLSDLQNNN
jgi:hypothetical protein